MCDFSTSSMGVLVFTTVLRDDFREDRGLNAKGAVYQVKEGGGVTAIKGYAFEG